MCVCVRVCVSLLLSLSKVRYQGNSLTLDYGYTPQTTDFDKDERYMATSDLCSELNKDTELGPYFEPKCVH